MTRPTARVLTLLDVLQSGGTRTLSELADRLDVNERTVRRYIDHLIDLEVPVESVRGRYGGYRLAPGHRMPPLMLTEDEALATMLGLLAGPRSPSEVATAGAAAAAKLRRVLPRAVVMRFDALLATTTFTGTGRAAGSAPDVSSEARVLLILAEAARDHHTVLISYVGREGRASERTLQPYGLVAHAGRWYVTGADSASTEIRTFRLDRISSPRVLPDTFTPPADFDPAGHVLTGLAQGPWTHQVSVRIQATAQQIRRRLPEGLATLEPLLRNDDADPPATPWLRVQLRAQNLDWVAAVLAGLDRPFVIEGPDELHSLVKDLARRLQDFADLL